MENDLFGCHGPNGIFGVRGIGGEVTEGLAVVQPRLFDLLGGVGVIDGGVFVRFVNGGVSLATKCFQSQLILECRIPVFFTLSLRWYSEGCFRVHVGFFIE